MPQRSHKRRSPAPGQLVLFDPFATHNDRDVFAPPCTSPTTFDAGYESGQDNQALLTPELPAAPPLESVRLAVLPASPDQPDQPEWPTVDLAHKWRPDRRVPVRRRRSGADRLTPRRGRASRFLRRARRLRITSTHQLTWSSDRPLASRPTLQRSSPSRHLALTAGQPPRMNEQSWRASAGSATAPSSRHSA